MRSGALARLAGVSTDTLRHYERIGVLARPPRSGGGYRLYPATALDRVLLVRRALSIGFTLQELVRILRVREGGGAPCRQVRELAAAKVEQLGKRITDLVKMRHHLETLLTNWDERLDRTPAGQRALLLESLRNDMAPEPGGIRGDPVVSGKSLDDRFERKG